MRLILFFQKRRKGQYLVDIFSMAYMHNTNNMFFIVNIANQAIVSYSISPEIFQVPFKGMSKIPRILLRNNMCRHIGGNLLLKGPINFAEFLFSFFVKANLPEGRISHRVYIFSQLLQKECRHLLQLPFLPGVEKQQDNLFDPQENSQWLSEYNSFQTYVFLKQAQKEDFLAFWGGLQST